MAQPAALGIDLGGTKIEAALLDPRGAIGWRQRVATPAGDYAATVRAVVALAAAARQHAGGAVSIGIGSPGTPGPGGLMKNCNSTCLNGQPLQRDLQAALGQPVALANDANCLALSEATDGAGAGADVVFAAILGTGTGGGIAVHGRVLTGPNGLAGEWGHNPLPWADAEEAQQPCYCGQCGCIEQWLCGPALARDHAAGLCHLHDAPQARPQDRPPDPPQDPPQDPPHDAAAIAAAAAAGDSACRATLARHSQRLARALAAVINMIDPDVIVLGGGLSLMPHLYEDVPAQWGGWVFAAGAPAARDRVRTRLMPSLHGDASGVRGAAWLGRRMPVGG